VGGAVAPAALAEAGVPVVLDGAQGAGAVPVDVRALGCAAYAAAGQKWLCGADGTGLLWIDPAFAERVRVVSPSYICFADVSRGLDSPLKETAARYDTPSLSREAVALSRAAVGVLEEAGWAAVHARAAALAETLAGELEALGRQVSARGPTTLVSWADPDAEATRDRLAAAGVAVRNLPGRGLVRASVGAWNDENDLDRLLGALG
jgi:L-cysteine/cystine lyase